MKLSNSKHKRKATQHVKDRSERLYDYKHLLTEHFIYSFLVDTNHRNGLEVHRINVNGLIYIYNNRNKKLITVLHPRPSQLKRYFGKNIPKEIHRLAGKCYKRNEEFELNFK